MANTNTTAKLAAQEDKKPTGAAGLPNTKPVGVKPRLSDEERAALKVKTLADHERLLQARVREVCQKLDRMGVASMAGRIGSYTDLDESYCLAAVATVQRSLDKCVAALKARSASKPQETPIDLKAEAARIRAQTQGTPGAGQ